MAYAVAHILVPIVILSVFRDFFVKHKKLFPLHYVLVGGIAGILPDLDVALFYILSFFGFTFKEIHRTWSHNIFIPVIFLVLGFVFYSFRNKRLGAHHLKLRNLFFVISFGIFMHLVLDFILMGYIIPFYPFSFYLIGLNLLYYFPVSWHNTIANSLDAALLVLWLIYLEVKHKVSDFL